MIVVRKLSREGVVISVENACEVVACSKQSWCLGTSFPFSFPGDSGSGSCNCSPCGGA